MKLFVTVPAGLFVLGDKRLRIKGRREEPQPRAHRLAFEHN